MHFARTAFLLTSVVALAACDGSSGDGITSYVVDLQPLNESGVNGTATINVDSEANVLSVTLNADGLDDTAHAQHIHARPAEIAVCPTSAADANADGFVDVVEGLPSYGGILLPLDNDISTQEATSEGFPSGTSIAYSTSASLGDVRSALAVTDDDDSDPVVTLGPDGTLAFSDFAIVVHGTTDDLPDTVASLPGLPNAATLPVACGAILTD